MGEVSHWSVDFSLLLIRRADREVRAPLINMLN